jgi:hypothetical protein
MSLYSEEKVNVGKPALLWWNRVNVLVGKIVLWLDFFFLWSIHCWGTTCYPQDFIQGCTSQNPPTDSPKISIYIYVHLLYLKQWDKSLTKISSWAEGVVECLPGIHQTLGLVPNTEKIKNKILSWACSPPLRVPEAETLSTPTCHPQQGHVTEFIYQNALISPGSITPSPIWPEETGSSVFWISDYSWVYREGKEQEK